MSGFCGVIDISGQPVEHGVLNPVMGLLSSFGGNASGVIEKPHFALGHHLRHDTPESLNEQQPFKHPARELYIVADAWLDNRSELCSLLDIPEDLPNSRLILSAYEKWGEACPEKLLGDFSFAIWDEEIHSLFCARDHIGARPFYYFQTKGQLYFASDIEALLCFNAIPAKLDVRYVKGRLEGKNYFHPEHTYFDGVKKLPFAHKMQFSSRGLTLGAHWQPENVSPLKLESEEAYSERLLELLDESIRCRSRALYPVGSHISGGLDSTTVTVLAARQHTASSPFQAFTWTASPNPEAPEIENDERESMEAVAKAENLKLHYTDLNPQIYLAQYRQDETRHPQHTLLAERMASLNAKHAGVKTLLSGWGGDEVITFNGRGYFADLFRRMQWAKLVSELRQRAKIKNNNWLKPLILDGILPNIPVPFVKSIPMIAKYHPAFKFDKNLPFPQHLHPEFAEFMKPVTTYEHAGAYDVPGIHTMQGRLIQHGHITFRMESWYAHGQRLGINYRYPLTDKRLFEFALSIPEDLFFKNGWKRYLFRRSVSGILPPELQWRKSKRDPALSDSYNQAAKRFHQEKGLQQDLIMQREKLQKQQFVDVDKLITTINSMQPEKLLDLGQHNVQQSLWLAFVGNDVFV